MAAYPRPYIALEQWIDDMLDLRAYAVWNELRHLSPDRVNTLDELLEVYKGCEADCKKK